MSGMVWGKFFWSDWRSDPGLRACSYAARGLWMDLLCIAAEADPKGFVLVAGRACDAKVIARMTGGLMDEVEALLTELEEHGVFSRNEAGAIYSRRMVADNARARGSTPEGAPSGNDLFGTQKPEARVQKPDSRKGRVRAGAPHALPVDWKLTKSDVEYAGQHGFSIGETGTMGDAFRDHHRNKGTKGIDWEAGFRTWVRNEIKFNRNRSGGSNGASQGTNGAKVGFAGISARLRAAAAAEQDLPFERPSDGPRPDDRY